ncbi:MAG TPA: Uma2 family endonuclease [Streptosporangiales bacterium]
MTVMAVMPRAAHEWTVDDLARLPDDGLQYELLDGILLVSPAPVPVHQVVAGNVYLALRTACPEGLRALFAPLDWQPDQRTSLQPDLLVVGRDDLGEKNITEPLLLAVEVLSPSTRRKDAVLKFSKYAECGVASYWLVDPAVPSVVAYDLLDGAYTEVARGEAGEQVALHQPLDVTLTPDRLVTD